MGAMIYHLFRSQPCSDFIYTIIMLERTIDFLLNTSQDRLGKLQRLWSGAIFLYDVPSKPRIGDWMQLDPCYGLVCRMASATTRDS